MSFTESEITAMLDRWSAGDPDALDRLIPVVFDEVRNIAKMYFRNESPGHTLQPTALVHEVYLRLRGKRSVQWQNRNHFFGAMAGMVRHVLVDHARRQKSAKRGGGIPKLPLDDFVLVAEERHADLVALDGALEALEILDPRQHRVVELKYFMGLTLEQIADVLDVAKSTVIRDWANARVFLQRELNRSEGSVDA